MTFPRILSSLGSPAFHQLRDVKMDVQIVDFPETKVAVLEHRGSPALEPESVRKLITWRLENRLPPDRPRS